MGLLQNSTSGFGTERLRGRSLVPNPPTRIRALIPPLEFVMVVEVLLLPEVLTAQEPEWTLA